jgi:GT2 family glycosyltransferase
MPQTAPVTAILVAYNSAKVIGWALRPLLEAPEIARIIVVDNCSHDETCDLVRRDFPTVELIENPRNDGFGRANNLALKIVQTPYALLINPDAALGQGALPELLRAAGEYPDAAIVAPALYDENGRLHHSFKRSVFAREKSAGIFTLPQGDCCADYVSGAAMLLNMELGKKMGFFDPAIFLFYEDDDLCLHARKAGHGLVYAPAARVAHLMGASSGQAKPAADFFKQQHMIWSRLYLEEKYRGGKASKKLATKLRLLYSLRAGFYTLQFNRKKLNRYRGRLAGIFAFSESKTTPPK